MIAAHILEHNKAKILRMYIGFHLGLVSNRGANIQSSNVFCNSIELIAETIHI